MARQKHNAVMYNTRGMFAKQVVFKERGGRVYVSGPPNTNENRVPTDPQKVIQDRFKEATSYAKSVMEIPDLKAAYKKVANPRQTAYNLAFKDAELIQFSKIAVLAGSLFSCVLGLITLYFTPEGVEESKM